MVVKPPVESQLGATRTELGPYDSFDLGSKAFTSKWTTAWHRSMKDASLNTHLQSTWLRNGSFLPRNGPQHGTTV